jgi:deoxycytidylate deaminase
VAAYSDYKNGEGRCIAIHAEDAALRKTTPEERKDGVMYITAVPCDDCEKLIRESGLARWEFVE